MSKRNLDQDLAEVRDTLPRVWWAIYTGCIDSGFTPDQAIKLVQTWIAGEAVATRRGE